MREHEIQQKIRAILNHPSAPTRVWRNNVGKRMIEGRWIEFGLAPGSGDLIGIKRVLVTAEMVGQYIGQFFSTEVKSAKGAIRKEQLVWQEVIRRFGGVAEIWRSPEEAQAFMEQL